MRFFRCIVSVVLMLTPVVAWTQWQSSIVRFDGKGRLIYTSDAQGNKIPDFSYAGYKNGLAAIPQPSVVKTVSPEPGDNTSNIQNAINDVAGLTPAADGFRGVLQMSAGMYRVSGTIRLNTSGIVLRGAGEGSDSVTNTIIYATGDSITQPAVIVAGGGTSGSAWTDAATGNVNILDDSVQVGEKTFTATSASGFSVGDNIILVHPKTTAWLRAVNWGGVPNDTGTTSYWATQSIDIKYNRYITAIDGNKITIDAPVFTTFVRSLAQCYFYKTSRTGILTNIGIENLRVDIKNPFNQLSTNSNGDERNHSQDAVWLGKIENAWIKHCTTLHFVQSGFKTSYATRVTIDSCSSLDPISTITGERRYNFNTFSGSQLILFSNCYAKYPRHAYVSNGASTVSGNVFYNCIADSSYASSEGHRLWSQGLLYDTFKDINPQTTIVLGLYNRGNYGSGHGWSAVHSVVWNSNVGSSKIILQQPPTAQNYAIGCVGNVTGAGPFAGGEGYVEGTNTPGINPSSLYMAQLNDRKASINGIKERSRTVPRKIQLYQNYPNPFNPETKIEFFVGTYYHTTLRVFDLLGREVAVLVNDNKPAGTYSVRWDASQYASGLYFARLESAGQMQVQKLVLTK